MVSVCLASYNGEKYIKSQIESILFQLGDFDEIIVSDDSSTDRTLDIIRSLNDKRIKIFPDQKFHSPIYNFENAIKQATGDYIFLSDQDDIWLDNKVEICLNELETYDLVVSDCRVVDKQLNVIYPSFHKIHNSKGGFLNNLYRNSYMGCCIAFRRSVLDYVLPFPKKLSVYHEGWICSLVDIKGKLYFLPTPLILYRRTEENLSQTSEKSTFSFMYQLYIRLHLLLNVLKRIVWNV